MPEIVTLAEAKQHCRILHDDEDAILRTYLDAATEAVLDTADAWDRTAEPPARLKLAVLARAAEAFESRERVPEAPQELRFLSPLRRLSV